MSKEQGVWACAAAAALAAAFAGFSEANEVVLVEGGQPRAAIVIRPGGRERAAARLLNEFFARMSGAELPVLSEGDLGNVRTADGRLDIEGGPAQGMNIVLIGTEELAQRLGVEAPRLGPGGVHLQTFENGIALLGGPGRVDGEPGWDNEGLQHAAIELLERLGCHYLWPGRAGWVVPRQQTVALPQMQYSYTPQIRMRHIRTRTAAQSAEGLALLGVTEEQVAAAMETARADGPDIEWNDWQRLGGRLPRMGHNGAGLGRDEDLIRELQETRPEWFALQGDGTRDQQGCPRWRLCKSNPDLIEFIANKIIEEVNDRPRALYSLCGNDRGLTNGHCLCDDCRALDPEDAPKVGLRIFPSADRSTRRHVEMPSITDRHVYYWNAIAERVAKVHPDLLFGVSAYQFHSHAPVRHTLHPNLVVRYVPGGPGYRAIAGVGDEVGLEEVAKWREAGVEHFFWRPNVLLANRTHGQLRSIVGNLCLMMNHFAEANINQTDFDSNVGHWATMGLSFYAAARLNWNPRLTPDEIIEDFAQAGFGEGAPYIAEYFRRVDRGPDRSADEADPSLEDIPGLRELLNSAEQAANDEEVSERVAFLRLGLNYTHLRELLEDKARRAEAGEPVDRDLARRLVDLNGLAMRDILLNHFDALNTAALAENIGGWRFRHYAAIGADTVVLSDEALLERVGSPDHGWTGREDSLEELLAAFGL